MTLTKQDLAKLSLEEKRELALKGEITLNNWFTGEVGMVVRKPEAKK